MDQPIDAYRIRLARTDEIGRSRVFMRRDLDGARPD
jgi:hypothetical protein